MVHELSQRCNTTHRDTVDSALLCVCSQNLCALQLNATSCIPKDGCAWDRIYNLCANQYDFHRHHDPTRFVHNVSRHRHRHQQRVPDHPTNHPTSTPTPLPTPVPSKKPTKCPSPVKTLLPPQNHSLLNPTSSPSFQQTSVAAQIPNKKLMIGCLLALIFSLLIIAVCCMRRKRRKQTQMAVNTHVGLDSTMAMESTVRAVSVEYAPIQRIKRSIASFMDSLNL